MEYIEAWMPKEGRGKRNPQVIWWAEYKKLRESNQQIELVEK
jgi:hypothetical protein